jgi:hypothetical protein
VYSTLTLPSTVIVLIYAKVVEERKYENYRQSSKLEDTIQDRLTEFLEHIPEMQ